MASSTAAFMSAQGTPGRINVDTQHEDLVHDAQLDYYGCKLATASSGEYVAKGSRLYVLVSIVDPILCRSSIHPGIHCL